jgi:Fusaric acid resistance protein family
MADAIDRDELGRDPSAAARWDAVLANAARAVGPPLLFGLRLWASVCLAIYVAFWLELDNAYWAGTSAAIVCQPQLGASLRKGWYRMIGTVVGAIMIVVLTGCFPQDRITFLATLALWSASRAFAATLLCNFASYSAALARGDHRRRHAGRDRRCQHGGLYAGGHARQRDRHRHRLRRPRSCRD